jgi:calcium channel MID1
VWALKVQAHGQEFLDIGVNLDLPIIAENSYGSAAKPIEIRKGGSEGLQEFTPIRATIGQSETQYYSFNVNSSRGLGEYYEFLIFLTGNICSQPDDLNATDPSLAVYYSFNSSMFSNLETAEMLLFRYGYFQALADVPVKQISDNSETVLYIAVRSPESTDRSATWMYEIGVSQNDLVFQWDDRSWATLVDADDDSALVVTGNLTDVGDFNYSDYNISQSRYSLFIYSYDYRNYFDSLNSSWCAIRNGPALFNTANFESRFIQRGGGLQQQFYVNKLNSSTKYVGYLISDFLGRDFGGAVYKQFEFETMSDDACSLIYDLDFCDQVAYSVPNNIEYSGEELRQLYDDRAKNLYANFTLALDQVACNTTDVAVFSPYRSCDDCAKSYKNWLCSVTIPRCSTRNITGYKKIDLGESRNDWINDVIDPYLPYYEVLPCLNVCQAIVRDCPSDFGFACPTHNRTSLWSYYWDEGNERFPTCNFVGDTPRLKSNAMRIAINIALLVVAFAVQFVV